MIVALVLTTTPTNVSAQVFNPVFYYYHSDHLGSSNIITDRAGVRVQHYEYMAFGKERYKENTSAFSLSNRYTDQVLDEETGLYYYNARYYDPELGRFIQPDTIVPDPGNPQALNRYTYVNNNPLKYVDPTGHFWEAIIVGVIVGAAIGAASSAANGGNVWLGALTGAVGGLLGGLGSWAGATIGAASGTASGATVGGFAGAVAGGAAGGAVNAAITGGDPGMGALTGAIAGGIGFGVARATQGLIRDMSIQSTAQAEIVELGGATAGGALGGGIGAELQGGDFGDGAAYGAAGAAIGYGTAYFLKYNNGPLKSGDRNLAHHAMQYLGKIWNLPNTLIGLAWGGLGYTIDRGGTLFGRQPQMKITWGHNSIQFENHPLMVTAITLGNTISYSSRYTPHTVGAEEFWHTFQAQQLGPLYLPSNILGMTAGLTVTWDTHGWINWNERGPHWKPAATWR